MSMDALVVSETITLSGIVVATGTDLPSRIVDSFEFPEPRRWLRVEGSDGDERVVLTAGAAVIEAPVQVGDRMQLDWLLLDQGPFAPRYAKLELRDGGGEVMYWYVEGGTIDESYFAPGFALALGAAECRRDSDCGTFERYRLSVTTPDGVFDLATAEQAAGERYEVRHLTAAFDVGAGHCTDWYVSEVGVVAERRSP